MTTDPIISTLCKFAETEIELALARLASVGGESDWLAIKFGWPAIWRKFELIEEDMRHWIPVKEFARRVGMTDAAIRHRISRKDISSKKVKGIYCIDIAELEFLDSHMTVKEFAKQEGKSTEVIFYHVRVGNIDGVKRFSKLYIKNGQTLKR